MKTDNFDTKHKLIPQVGWILIESNSTDSHLVFYKKIKHWIQKTCWDDLVQISIIDNRSATSSRIYFVAGKLQSNESQVLEITPQTKIISVIRTLHTWLFQRDDLEELS